MSVLAALCAVKDALARIERAPAGDGSCYACWGSYDAVNETCARRVLEGQLVCVLCNALHEAGAAAFLELWDELQLG